MFDQQLDLEGGLHDLERPSQQDRLFVPQAPQIPGQTSMAEEMNAPEKVEARRAMFQTFGWTR